jgi:hypothetical protein
MDQFEHIGLCLDWKDEEIGWRGLRRAFHGCGKALGRAQALGELDF